METPSDSDRSRKERRRTALEIFFEEEPLFTDSEDETDFLRLNFGAHVQTTTPEITSDKQPSNNLSKKILQACCGECVCCCKIKGLLNISPEPPTQPSHEDDFEASAKRRKLSEKKVTNTINIISNHVIKSPQSSSASKNSSVESNSTFQHPMHDIYTQEKSRKGAVKRRGRQRKSKEPPKPNKGKNRKPNKHLESPELPESEQENNYCDSVNSDVLPEIKPLISTSKTENVRQRLVFDSEGNTVNNKNKPPRKVISKSLSNLSCSDPARGALSEYQSKSLITIEDYEPRRSGRKQKIRKKTETEPQMPNQRRDWIYNMMDKRIFKMPIDTTSGRGFETAIMRKLARGGALNLTPQALSIDHEDFRCHATRRPKKLYSPENWLNSPEFSQICQTYDD